MHRGITLSISDHPYTILSHSFQFHHGKPRLAVFYKPCLSVACLIFKQRSLFMNIKKSQNGNELLVTVEGRIDTVTAILGFAVIAVLGAAG